MDQTFVICGLAIFMAGLLLGMGIELIVNCHEMLRLEDENRHFRSELAKKHRVAELEHLEILDHKESVIDETEDFFIF